MKDAQRQATYDAEYRVRAALENDGQCMIVHGTTISIPVERRFASLESVQSYVDSVLALNWVRTAYPNAATPITVRKRTGSQNKATYYSLESAIGIPDAGYGLPGWAMREIVVLHEIAHHLTCGDGHGSAFRGAFTELVTNIIGFEIGWLLGVRFMEAGLRVG